MTTKAQILKSIRHKCIDCCVGQIGEVRNCHLQDCSLWPYRFGTDPSPSKTGFAKNPSSTRQVFSKKGGGESCPSTNTSATHIEEGMLDG